MPNCINSKQITYFYVDPVKVFGIFINGSDTIVTQLHVLHVEDSEAFSKIVARQLKQGDYNVVIKRVDSPEELKTALDEQIWDIVISDYEMPDFTGLDALAIVKRMKPDLPFIIVSGVITDEIAVAAMKEGAKDYIMKNNLVRLMPTVQREIIEAEIRLSQKQAQNKLEHQAYYDTLSDLPNVLFFKERLGSVLVNAQKNKKIIAVLFLNLDRFKIVNDTLGYASGDKLLQAVAERFKNSVRGEDMLARMGSDEFLFFLIDVNREENVAEIAQRILDTLKPAFNINDKNLYINGSIGISLFPNDGEDVDSLLKNADIALHRAKKEGGNKYQFYSPKMNTKTEEHLTLEFLLRAALNEEQFLNYYQPQVDIKSGEIIGVEALLRWQHPERGIVPPMDFIPLAEETGLIVPIGEWVLRAACEKNKAWQKLGLPPIRVAVNFSARQLLENNLIDMVTRVLEETGLDPRYLEIEITEHTAMQNAELTLDILYYLNKLGINIAIDDFGTGYSSLSYLKLFPVHTLKIDKSFIQDLSANSPEVAIVNAVISLAHGLKMKVVAEGVETKEQLAILQSLNCDIVQGYLFSKPLPPASVEELLRSKTLSLSF